MIDLGEDFISDLAVEREFPDHQTRQEDWDHQLLRRMGLSTETYMLCQYPDLCGWKVMKISRMVDIVVDGLCSTRHLWMRSRTDVSALK
jgi:hypothetical protein